MTTIQDLEERLNSFEQTLLQMARNNVPITEKVDQTSNRVDEITPYTDTKIAYFGEKEKVFYEVPEGNTTVFLEDYFGTYSVNRIADRLIVSFPALEKAVKITVMVQ